MFEKFHKIFTKWFKNLWKTFSIFLQSFYNFLHNFMFRRNFKKTFSKFLHNFGNNSSKFCSQLFQSFSKIFWKFCQNYMNIIIPKIRGVLQKFYIAQLFSTCGNTVASKLCVHVVTEAIPSTHMKFCSIRLKVTRWQEKQWWQVLQQMCPRISNNVLVGIYSITWHTI